MCSAWIALTPANEENGAMKIFPGSHTFGQLDHEDTFATENLLARGQRLVEHPNEEAAVSLSLEPGEISLHHIMAVNRSKPNQTDQRRIGFAIRYAATHVRLLGDSYARKRKLSYSFLSCQVFRRLTVIVFIHLSFHTGREYISPPSIADLIRIYIRSQL